MNFFLTTGTPWYNKIFREVRHTSAGTLQIFVCVQSIGILIEFFESFTIEAALCSEILLVSIFRGVDDFFQR